MIGLEKLIKRRCFVLVFSVHLDGGSLEQNEEQLAGLAEQQASGVLLHELVGVQAGIGEIRAPEHQPAPVHPSDLRVRRLHERLPTAPVRQVAGHRSRQVPESPVRAECDVTFRTTGGYAKFNGLKAHNKNLRTLLAIGGWNEGSQRFSKLVADPEARQNLVKSAIKYLRQHNFDGLDLDWEYPASRDGSKEADRANYALLVKVRVLLFLMTSSKQVSVMFFIIIIFVCVLCNFTGTARGVQQGEGQPREAAAHDGRARGHRHH